MGNWRNAFKSDFMAAWDIDSNVILTIQRVEQKDVQLQKKELKNVAYFHEKTYSNGENVKPMILNATNCKKLNMYTGTKETSAWVNLEVEIGIVENKGRIGEANGLAILRVLKGGIDHLGNIKTLLDQVKSELNPEELTGVERVINNQEYNSYNKVINFLNSKIKTND